jgi:hypothetical protein
MRLPNTAYICVLSLALLLATLSVIPATAYGSVRVGGSSLRANGELAQGFQYSGSCPVDLKFGWGLIASEPTGVSFSFSRNDGGQGPSRSVDLPSANRSTPVYYDWRLGANTLQFANYHGWVQLNIGSPNAVTQRIAFTLHCGGGSGEAAGGGVRIGGASLRANGQLAQGFQYAGACPVDLKFGWGVIGTEPTTISYSFARSDGGRASNSQTAGLPGGGRSVPIYYDWRLGANSPRFANFSGWVQINIDSPNAVSQKIRFTLHCGGM